MWKARALLLVIILAGGAVWSFAGVGVVRAITPNAAADSVPQDVLNLIGLLAAYHDSIGNNADSIRAETCRGGTLSSTGRCSGRQLAPRTTRLFVWSERIRHQKYRADSVMNQYVIHKNP